MDVTFLLRARRLGGDRKPAPLDHMMLTAALAAQQAASAAARAQAGAAPRGDAEADREPLSELLLGGPGWRQAAAAQQGCFNRAGMKRRVNLS